MNITHNITTQAPSEYYTTSQHRLHIHQRNMEKGSEASERYCHLHHLHSSNWPCLLKHTMFSCFRPLWTGQKLVKHHSIEPCNWFLNRTQNSVLLKCLQTSSVRGLAPNESVARKLRICTGDPPVINHSQMKEKKEAIPAIPETNYKMEQTGNNVAPRH